MDQICDLWFVLFPKGVHSELTILLAGDLVYLTVFGQNILIVNSAKAAYELFEQRSRNYSDRARFGMIELYVIATP